MPSHENDLKRANHKITDIFFVSTKVILNLWVMFYPSEWSSTVIVFVITPISFVITNNKNSYHYGHSHMPV